MEREECLGLISKVIQSNMAALLLNSITQQKIEYVDGKEQLIIKCVDTDKNKNYGNGKSITARAVFQADKLNDPEAAMPEIIIHSNKIANEKEMEEAVVHELIHAYDHIVRKKNMGTCEGLAASEVRAAKFAECSIEYGSSNFCSKFNIDLLKDDEHETNKLLYKTCKYFNKKCVRKYSYQSTKSMYPKNASKCLDKIFNESFEDYAPLRL